MTHVITTTDALEKFCEPLRGASFITFDTEFIREKTYYPQLCLMQICGPDATHAAAIDTLATGLDLSPVYALLDDTNIVKVMHAGKQDIEILVNRQGRIPAPLFDTQVAAMVCGYGEQIGYESIVRQLTGTSIDKSQQFTDWAQRPLSPQQITYAIADVVHLCAVYRALLSELTQGNRLQWMDEEITKMQDLSAYVVEPKDAWLRQKKRHGSPHYLARLRALAAWREQEAQARDVPRGRLIKDDTLQELAMTAPKNLAALSRARGLGNHLSQQQKETLLQLVAEASVLPREACPVSEPHRPVSPTHELQRDLLKLLLKLVCERQRISPRLVADGDMLSAMIEGQRELPVFNGWRYDLFGKLALPLLEGKLALGIDPAQQTVVEFSKE
ncbi:MAG: ribonuclease D [Rickettsiales bacterium]|nr:ribonuclease D [Rickettsiales bacterium]